MNGNKSTSSSGVPSGGGLRSSNPPLPEIPKLSQIPKIRGKYIRNNLIRIRVSLICKLSGTPDYGGYRPQISVLSALYPQLNLLNLPPKKIPCETPKKIPCETPQTIPGETPQKIPGETP
jgi:hypothetical protein